MVIDRFLSAAALRFLGTQSEGHFSGFGKIFVYERIGQHGAP